MWIKMHTTWWVCWLVHWLLCHHVPFRLVCRPLNPNMCLKLLTLFTTIHLRTQPKLCLQLQGCRSVSKLRNEDLCDFALMSGWLLGTQLIRCLCWCLPHHTRFVRRHCNEDLCIGMSQRNNRIGKLLCGFFHTSLRKTMSPNACIVCQKRHQNVCIRMPTSHLRWQLHKEMRVSVFADSRSDLCG